jgi:hypothetical protein
MSFYVCFVGLCKRTTACASTKRVCPHHNRSDGVLAAYSCAAFATSRVPRSIATPLFAACINVTDFTRRFAHTASTPTHSQAHMCTHLPIPIRTTQKHTIPHHPPLPARYTARSSLTFITQHRAVLWRVSLRGTMGPSLLTARLGQVRVSRHTPFSCGPRHSTPSSPIHNL